VTVPVPAVGDLITAAFGSTVAGRLNSRLLGNNIDNSNATSSGATETLHIGLVLSVTGIVAGQTYFIDTFGRYSAAGATAVIVKVHASQSAITTASPVVLYGQASVGGAGGGFAFDISARAPWTPGASGTWNLQVGVQSGTGTNATFGAAGNGLCSVSLTIA
jgi:hypothetical protein